MAPQPPQIVENCTWLTQIVIRTLHLCSLPSMVISEGENWHPKNYKLENHIDHKLVTRLLCPLRVDQLLAYGIKGGIQVLQKLHSGNCLYVIFLAPRIFCGLHQGTLWATTRMPRVQRLKAVHSFAVLDERPCEALHSMHKISAIFDQHQKMVIPDIPKTSFPDQNLSIKFQQFSCRLWYLGH